MNTDDLTLAQLVDDIENHLRANPEAHQALSDAVLRLDPSYEKSLEQLFPEEKP